MTGTGYFIQNCQFRNAFNAGTCNESELEGAWINNSAKFFLCVKVRKPI